ncbi:ribosome biogenesis protein NOP53-like [Actinia tenebrosa]|uniref:Ribosome biogenesis protein NOP53 n=1 Tax=Actinia tenebrosa TaxID=6105 RepID=A0A6P8HSA5_ACTTE|nr:ribosome biogenesis protein NOP53-like [Actinia tenebrosa]
MASEVNVLKKKKYSKKSKRNWRKQTDIKDVEEFLEEVRRDERTGGPAADKADGSLFFVDTIKLKTPDEDKSVTKRSRKRKLLKQDELLLPDTRIKPVGSKKPKVNKKKTKKGKDFDSESSDEEIPADKNRNQVKSKEKKEQKESRGYFDLWSTEDKLQGDEHYLKITRKTKIKAPKTVKRKVTELPAVEVAAPGASYNPTFEEHQELLQKAHEVEVKKNKRIEKLNRQLQWLSKEEASDLPTWEEEMGQGLFDEIKNDDDKAHDDDDDNDDDGVITIKSAQRKTRQQRRKEKEEMKQQLEQEAEKKLKLKENEVFRIKSLKKEIEAKEKEIKQKLQKKEELKEGELKKPKRLGRHGFEEAAVEIQLSDEITGNLRSIKPEGNLFADRFKSLQKRNLIEPRKPVLPHRKYAKKEYVKKSYDKPCVKEIAAEGK